MEPFFKVVHFTILLFGFVGSSVLPVEKCKLDDSSCLTAAFQTALPTFIDGMPALGVEVEDPLEMDDLAFDLSGLQFTLKEGRLRGLKASIIDKVKWDLKKMRLQIDYHMNCTVRGHYTAAGRLLILPISGDGQFRSKVRNLNIALFLDYKMVKGRDGKEHVKPTKYDFTFDVKDSAYFNLTGLFQGNKELSDTLLTFLNQNWQPVSVEFGRPIFEAAAKKVFKNVVAFFDSVPIGEIADV